MKRGSVVEGLCQFLENVPGDIAFGTFFLAILIGEWLLPGWASLSIYAPIVLPTVWFGVGCLSFIKAVQNQLWLSIRRKSWTRIFASAKIYKNRL